MGGLDDALTSLVGRNGFGDPLFGDSWVHCGFRFIRRKRVVNKGGVVGVVCEWYVYIEAVVVHDDLNGYVHSSSSTMCSNQSYEMRRRDLRKRIEAYQLMKRKGKINR